MDKFEYKILNISRAHLRRDSFQAELIERMNTLGNDGWELINAEGLSAGGMIWSGTEEVLFIFKRKKG